MRHPSDRRARHCPAVEDPDPRAGALHAPYAAYSGGCRPGEVTQSLRCALVAAKRAFLRSCSRSAPAGSRAACSLSWVACSSQAFFKRPVVLHSAASLRHGAIPCAMNANPKPNKVSSVPAPERRSPTTRGASSSGRRAADVRPDFNCSGLLVAAMYIDDRGKDGPGRGGFWGSWAGAAGGAWTLGGQAFGA